MGASGLVSPGAAESSLRDVQPGDFGGTVSSHAVPNQTNVETQRGTDHLHGQAFIFDRENLWDARNPFTQWMQETARFAEQHDSGVYAPSLHSRRSRSAVGRRPRWCHSQTAPVLVCSARRHMNAIIPVVATVKHPDNFFAQPSNDQMQLLSAQLGLNSADPVSAGLGAYSKLLESLAGLLGPAPRSSSQWIRLRPHRLERRRAPSLHAARQRPRDSMRPAAVSPALQKPMERTVSATCNANAQWMLGRWEAFLTPNLLAVTQGSYGHQVQSATAETPSAFEQSLNINAWGQLPQIVVDSRYGFTIGNPARFGRGNLSRRASLHGAGAAELGSRQSDDESRR